VTSYVEPHMKEVMERLYLKEVVDTERIQSFYMRQPSTRIYCVLITFTPEGIVIQGDLTIGHNGTVSTIGYGLSWFKGRLSGDYLCEKFLPMSWNHDRVESDITYYAADESEDLRDETDAEMPWNSLLAWWEENGEYSGEESLYQKMMELGLETVDGVPGRGYKSADAGWLCAVQQRFAELYDAR